MMFYQRKLNCFMRLRHSLLLHCQFPLIMFPTYLLQIMDETQTQIAWPSKLKIGAKSKKGDFSSFSYHFSIIFLLDPCSVSCLVWLSIWWILCQIQSKHAVKSALSIWLPLFFSKCVTLVENYSMFESRWVTSPLNPTTWVCERSRGRPIMG